ncbi:uncharacterized protein RCC_06376 [Ramularia collo-cygni]|uniref:Uncharacterized protein n=1 Tax=Ramularia collo-cygni TaxID=112498 RepID=A0A2D3VA50_9PEZI|nr:uncharacterized protein RCC_06376 [Ramularia collo-cygni]CZT20516.1 uncharacterized protein RCC_06376 [Ramularia collo-cygni]
MLFLRTFTLLAAVAGLTNAQKKRARKITFDGPAYANAPTPALLGPDSGIPVGNAGALNFFNFTVVNVASNQVQLFDPNTRPNIAIITGPARGGKKFAKIEKKEGFPNFELDSLYFRCARKLSAVYVPIDCTLLLSYPSIAGQLDSNRDSEIAVTSRAMQFEEFAFGEVSYVRFGVSVPKDILAELATNEVSVFFDTIKVKA